MSGLEEKQCTVKQSSVSGIRNRNRGSIIHASPQAQYEALVEYNLLDEKGMGNTTSFVNEYNRLRVTEHALEKNLENPISSTFTQEAKENAKRQLTDAVNHQPIFLGIANAIIDRVKSTTFGADEYRELIELARIQDESLIKNLLGCLLAPHLFSHPLRMQALKAVLLTIGPEFYKDNVDTLFRITDLLLQQLEDTHTQKQSYHEFVDTLEALHINWLALSLVGASGANEARSQKQADYFKKLSDHPYKPLAYRAKLIAQSLSRIDRDTGPAWKRNCLRGYRMLSGIVITTSAMLDADIAAFEEGMSRIYSAVVSGEASKKPWYDTILALESALGDAGQSPSHFNSFVQALAGVIARSPRKTELSYGIFELVQRIALNNTLSPPVRSAAILILQEMYTDKKKWHADIAVLAGQGLGDGDEGIFKGILNSLVTLSVTTSPVTEQACIALFALYDYFKAKPKPTDFEKNAQKYLNRFMPTRVVPGADKADPVLLKRAEKVCLTSLPVGKQLLGYVIQKINQERGSLKPAFSQSALMGTTGLFSIPPIDQFLTHVVHGDQKKAELMLKETPQLLLQKSTITDLSGREFKDITAFQYAVWALDWHMWTMLLKHFSKIEAAEEQYKELEEKNTIHGKCFSFDPLIDALRSYLEEYEDWTLTIGARDWLKVGEAQRLLPAHVINEYCRPESFTEGRTFAEDSLPRSMKISVGEWFEGTYNGKKIGVFGVVRSPEPNSLPQAGGNVNGQMDEEWCRANLQAIIKLSEVRALQRSTLKKNLGGHREHHYGQKSKPAQPMLS